VVLTTEAAVVASERLLVVLRPPARFGGKVRALPSDRARLRLHLGTDQAEARVGRAGRESTELDQGRVTALLRLDRPIAAAPGDRFVLRRPATHLTEAAGVVLDASPPIGAARRRATPGRLTVLVAARSPDQRERALLDLHGIRLDGHAATLAPDLEAASRATALERVGRHHVERPTEVGMPVAGLRAEVTSSLRRSVAAPARVMDGAVAAVIDGLVGEGSLTPDGDRVRLPNHRPAIKPGLAAAMDRLEAALAFASPPSLQAAMLATGCPAEGVVALERAGRIVRLDDDLAWSVEVYRGLARQALKLARNKALTPAAFRDETGTSRKYVMAILEDLDRRGILRRTPEGHVPGPRSATLDAEAAPVSAGR
jgi:selenocysteine-specific elongation factor